MNPYMHSHFNHPPIPHQNQAVRTTPPLSNDSYYMMQRMTNLESQLAKLISLIEENNQLIKSMEQQQNQVCAPGGGSVIVRM